MSEVTPGKIFPLLPAIVETVSRLLRFPVPQHKVPFHIKFYVSFHELMIKIAAVDNKDQKRKDIFHKYINSNEQKQTPSNRQN